MQSFNILHFDPPVKRTIAIFRNRGSRGQENYKVEEEFLFGQR